MIDIVKQYARIPFVKNVATVAAGTAFAQIITISFSPIITRLYGPESFGILGVFLAITGILTSISSLTYARAIVLPKEDYEAQNIVRLSIAVSLILVLVIFTALLFFQKPISALLNIETIGGLIYLIPLVLLFFSITEAANQWLIRKNLFRVTAKVMILQALITNILKSILGIFKPLASVLIILSTLSKAIHAGLLTASIKEFSFRNLLRNINKNYHKRQELISCARKYKDFPLFQAPQGLINTLSQNLPVILLSTFFSPAAAGFYSIGNKLLNMPISLIGKSVGSVIYPKLAEAKNDNKKIAPILIKATLGLMLLGIIPFGIIVAFGPDIFKFAFGQEWITAGIYARWMALWLYFGFINKPVAMAIPVLTLQGKYLFYEILNISLRIVAISIGYYYYQSDLTAIKLFSFAGILLNIMLVIYVIRYSKIIDFINNKN